AKTAPQTLRGTAQDGQIPTACPGTWTGTQAIIYTCQWQRCDWDGANCNPTAGATSTTYTVVSADFGGTIAVVVQASNAAGNASAPSSHTAIVQAVPPAVATEPTVSGLAQEGQTLTAA